MRLPCWADSKRHPDEGNRHMANETAGTKQALILAAGELFAETGLDGASVRAIAEKVGANIAAINYHFGSKENLYTEALLHVIQECECHGAREALLHEEHFSTPERKAGLLRDLVRERFTSYFSPTRPQWYGRLVIRSMQDPTPSLETVVKQLMFPEHEALVKVFQRVNPALSDDAARLWAFSLIGQIGFYVFGESVILMVLNTRRYEPDFLEKAAAHVARTLIAAMALPLPAGL